MAAPADMAVSKRVTHRWQWLITHSIARVTRWMALAIHLERMLRDGEVRDQADLARLGGVTRARITQILNLLHLAPYIQEELLFMTHNSPRDPIILSDLQPITRMLNWARQRQMWKALCKQFR